MNIVEKILARGSGKSKVSPDDVIFANVDKVMIHDVSGPGVIKVFDKLKKQGIPVDKLWDPTKVWVAEDHFVPSADKISAENIVKLSKFTKRYGIEKHFKYGMGQYGTDFLFFLNNSMIFRITGITLFCRNPMTYLTQHSIAIRTST